MSEEYNLNFTDQYNWYCKVSKLKQNESIYLKRTAADADWNPTTFGFHLETHEYIALLKFTHTNWQKNNHEFRNTSYFWALLLKGLKKYIETGVVVLFEVRN